MAFADFFPECVCFPCEMLQLSALGQYAVKALIKSRNSCLHVPLALHELPSVIAHDVLGPFRMHEEQTSTLRSILGKAVQEGEQDVPGLSSPQPLH